MTMFSLGLLTGAVVYYLLYTYGLELYYIRFLVICPSCCSSAINKGSTRGDFIRYLRRSSAEESTTNISDIQIGDLFKLNFTSRHLLLGLNIL